MGKMGAARKDEDEDSIYSKFGACWHWNGAHRRLGYKICRKIYEYISITGRSYEVHGENYIDMDVEVDYFVRIIKAVFLYIALKNERKRIVEQAFIEGVELYKIEEVSESPENEKTEGKRKQNKVKVSKTFRDLIQYEDPDKLLKRLHVLIDGRKGAAVGAVLMNAFYNKSYLTKKPTKAEFESEFGKVSKSGWEAIRKYMDDNNMNAIGRASQIAIFT